MANIHEQDERKVSPQQVVNWGHEVLGEAAKAIELAGERLDQRFAAAVELIYRCKGKVVVTGLGKSGHIGVKLAATLSSTGTSALFVHASEALHGDFGMISPQDCLIAIAFGGETREVLSVVNFVKNYQQPVIAITGNLASSLARRSDVVLDGRVEREADPLGLAPTTSSTLALVLGDALAVALMHYRQFTKEHFYALHPGGRLGRSLAKVSQLMCPLAKLPVVAPSDNFHAILQAVTTPNFGICAVTDSAANLVGVISDGDLRRSLLHHGAEALEFNAQALMNSQPKTISPEVRAIDAITLMEVFKVTAVFVQEESSKKLVGLLRLHDLLDAKIV